MSKYYKPTATDLQVGLKIEFYADETWHPHVVEDLKGWWKFLENDEIRVKYLDSEDFNELGYIIGKEIVKWQDVIVDIIPQLDGTDKEITEKQALYDEEHLTILHNSVKVGVFRPVPVKEDKAQFNVVLQGEKHLIKNLTELRKILK